jgi:curved DNA-binding protein CbpA
MTPVTLYEVLGVSPSAPAAEVRQAYVTLARQHHPDREGGDATRMRAVNEAWATLRDPARRAEYDLTLRAPTTAPSSADDATPWRTDDEDLLADLADDTPLGGQVVLPPWLSIVPVAVFALSILAVVAGMLFASTPALGAAVGLFLLSCGLFLVAPFVALLSSRRRSSARGPEGSR